MTKVETVYDEGFGEQAVGARTTLTGTVVDHQIDPK